MTLRRNAATQSFDSYFRLMESYRNADGSCSQKTLLTIGVWNEASPEQINKIAAHLTQRERSRISIFEEEDTYVKEQVEFIWQLLITKGKVDVSEAAKVKRKRLIFEDSLVHKDAREVGAEWLCYQAIQQLDLDKCLSHSGWDESKIKLSQTQIISRAVYPASELETVRWIKENSAVCDITQYPKGNINKDKLYRNALCLYQAKDKIEKHLSVKTNELFDIQDKIICSTLPTRILRVGNKIANWQNLVKAKRNATMQNW